MDLTGERIAHYDLVAKLGEGGMGSVYRARDVRLGRHIALKLLPKHGAADGRARFLAEAQAVSSLEHPHICMLYEFEGEGEQPFLAMQLVDGETLKCAIERGALEEGRARQVIMAVGSALSAAHARGIVHRDVKSDNILLGADGAIKLTDFGIARLSEDAGLTATRTVVGTTSYMAPERLEGKPAGPEADQFALGVVAYECVTGRLPFAGETMAAVFYAIVNRVPDPPSRVRPGLEPTWDAAIGRALAKRPEDRFRSIQEFVEAIASTPFAEALRKAVTPLGAVHPSAAPSVAANAAAPRAAESLPKVSSVAVLPFENHSSDPESDYFCDGIGEDIRTDLSKIPGLQVASSHAVARYRGTRPDVREIGMDLNVRSVVAGTVRRAGERVRISVELTDAMTGYQTWAERFDRTLDDVFAVQEEIAHAVVAALRGVLTPHEAAELQRERPAEVAAYDLYLKGRDFYRRYTPEDNRRALECFERATEIDPSYALAWAGIADGCAQMNDKGWDKDPALLDRGFAAARRAVELDPRLAEGHKAEALIWRTRRDRVRSVDALMRALTANPAFIPALINLAHEMLCDGDFAGAERALRRAVAADPAYGFSTLMLAVVAVYTRRYDEAIEHAHRAQSAGQSAFFSTHAHALRAQAYLESGDSAGAVREIAGLRAAGASTGMLKALEALNAARAGESGPADRWIDELVQMPPSESYGCELAAAAAATRGRVGDATRLLEAAERIDPRHPAYWRMSPGLVAARDETAFRTFIGERGRQLVWPTQAPELPESDRRQFYVYRQASGLPRADAMP